MNAALSADTAESFLTTVQLVGQSGRSPSPGIAVRIKRAYKLRQQPVELRQRELLGVLFCGDQDAFFQMPDFIKECVPRSHSTNSPKSLEQRPARNALRLVDTTSVGRKVTLLSPRSCDTKTSPYRRHPALSTGGGVARSIGPIGDREG
jgi:hypothetical protein